MDQDIETPDGPVTVPRNLHDALIHLRDPAKSLYVWADRACVNHADEVERSHQARLMRSIFKSAERVIVWLGTDARNRAQTAFAVLCGVASGGEVNGHSVGQANFYVDGASSANLPDMPCRDGPPPTGFKMFWNAVAEMFALGWFWDVACIQQVRSCP
jgi:Heterokaryon incompatibility protein (HET)